ncbi:hypothetical protein TNCV_4008371 [Trichonephila clavipes]|nr:hypothetical protein TNCV_4008371 [Trichonephila clavipes]
MTIITRLRRPKVHGSLVVKLTDSWPACHEFKLTRRVGEQCTLNLSRAQTSSRWCNVEVRRGVPAHVSSSSLYRGSKLRDSAVKKLLQQSGNPQRNYNGLLNLSFETAFHPMSVQSNLAQSSWCGSSCVVFITWQFKL